MKNKIIRFSGPLTFLFFLLMAMASVPPQHTTYRKPVVYPCVRHPALTYSPILLKFNISSNYTMKDLSAIRQSDPGMLMDALRSLNYSYQLADGVRPNLVLNITYTNDGYDHYGASIYVDWQGQANFTITLPNNYITGAQLIKDIASQFNVWVTQGWHEGNCN